MTLYGHLASVRVACSNCGHVFNRRDLKPGDIVRCKLTAPAVPVVAVKEASRA